MDLYPSIAGGRARNLAEENASTKPIKWPGGGPTCWGKFVLFELPGLGRFAAGRKLGKVVLFDLPGLGRFAAAAGHKLGKVVLFDLPGLCRFAVGH